MSHASPTIRVTVPSPRPKTVRLSEPPPEAAPEPPEPVTYARVRAAFARLDTSGIVARAGYGTAMITALDDIAHEDPQARGYVLCTQAEAAAATDSLPLAFGALRTASDLPVRLVKAADADEDSFERSQARARVWELSSEQIGQEVAAVLRSFGLSVTWDGTSGSRIRVAL